MQDDGTGGTNLDPTARSMTVNVNEVDHAPQGTNTTVSTTENGVYTFATADFGFSDPNDSPANNLLAVKITTVPGAGSLTDNGVVVTAGQFVSASDISGGKLVFTPGANGWGNSYAAFTFQVQDDGSGGTNLDATPRSMTVDVTQVDHAPQGTNNTVTTTENGAYTFATVDFGFSDPNDSPANNLLAVKITTLPGAGSLADNGVAVTAGQFVSASDISSGKLVFTPGANVWGNNYTAFSFQVQDDGSAGTNLDATPRSMTVNVSEVNHAPQGASNTVSTLENSAYTFAVADFGFSDPNDSPANNLQAVQISALPGAGRLTDNSVAVGAGQFISVADILGGKLKFTPALNASGVAYAMFGFQVQDDGGTANGGLNTDPVARTMTVDVTFVNQPPVLGYSRLTITQGGAVVLSGANLSATDVDNPASSLVFAVSNVVNGHFELVSNPGTPVSSFTQAAVASAQVRFVDNASGAAPAFDVTVSDGSLTVGPVSASVSFSLLPSGLPAPTPPVPITTPVPVPVSAPSAPPAQPAPAPQPSPGGGGQPGAGHSAQVLSGGRAAAAAAETTSTESSVQPQTAAGVLAELPRVKAKLNGPPANLRAQELELFVQGGELPSLQSSLPTTPNWTAQTAFPDDGDGSNQGRMTFAMDSVEMGGIVLSVGVVFWASRVSGLLGSLLASMPAWRHLDPVPILGRDEDDEHEKDADNLGSAEVYADELAISMVLEGPRNRMTAPA